ncbi:ABC-type transport system, substrate-binding protein [Cribrihabitans marinus]|uniref:ABC-type transport system, substrate-binding protein n=1 Tax=Cribrihabitans marinus TaxID=1227549 RepID=A0A1H7DZ81_9RHOB|nr:ABC transporter substrate-binding protein [Cribrihabitans marinus]GGH40008.1 ABC transporter substrate-binding protein [Cribrihabitans marinus]SEK04630.1 ABC-type transport system, substrate-binding protein [Cribrihabitans marinus]
MLTKALPHSFRGRLVVAAAALLLTLPVAPSAALADGTLTIGRPADVSAMSVFSHSTIEDEIVHPMLFDTLVYGSKDDPGYVPGLAESWDFDSASNSYVFKLRANAAFSDGSPVTAADVVYSLSAAKEKSQNYKGMLAGMTAAEAVDDHTVKVTLAGPDNIFMSGLIWVYVLPENMNGKDADAFFAEPLASGPFALDAWTPGSSMSLVRNPHYWNAAETGLDRVDMKIIQGDNERLAAFQSGDIDIYENVRFDFIDQIPEAQRHIVSPTARTMFLFTNNYKPPFDSIEARKALSYAVDRDAIGEALWPGLSVPVQGMLMPGTTGAVPADAGSWDFDLETAEAALAASPTPKPEITLSAAYIRGVDEVLVQAVQAQLQDAGFQVTLNVSDFNTILGQVLNGEFDVWLLGNTTFGTTVAEMFAFYGGAFGPLGGWDLDALGGALEKYLVAPDAAGREAAVRDFENMMRETFTAVPIGHPDTVFAIADGVEGFETLPTTAYRLDRISVNR